MTSDKFSWHRFGDLYNKRLPLSPQVIAEFGVYKGDSIRWLHSKYPDALIYGADILDQQPTWPVHSKIEYIKCDQSKSYEVSRFFAEVGSPDLIIEDGSHRPLHQLRCLYYGIRALNSGGTYILEDLHTSHPSHQLYKKTYSFPLNLYNGRTSPLSLILFWERALKIGTNPLELLKTLNFSSSSITIEQVAEITSRIKSVIIYKRSTAPLSCFKCGSKELDYNQFKCVCGQDFYSCADSMSAIILIK